ncbi:MAG: DoxX family membrane protein [Chloroflexi bacterium]|nr:DoxX family membrane protein [Chloroflexota bacterium]
MDAWLIFLISLSRWILGTTLLLAALTKWFDIASFQRIIVRWQLGRQEWSLIVTWGISSLETIIGVALLLNFYSKIVAVFSIGLLTAFTLLLSFRLIKGETEGCGCFGSSKNDKITPLTLIRNIFFNLGNPNRGLESLPCSISIINCSYCLGKKTNIIKSRQRYAGYSFLNGH